MKRLLSHSASRFLFLLCSTVLIAGCGKGCADKGGGSGKVDAGVLSLIPAQNNFLLNLDWKKLQASPLGEKLKGKVPPEAEVFMKDVDNVTLGVQAQGVGQEPETLAVISGKIDSATVLAQLSEQAKKAGVEVSSEDYEGSKLHQLPKDPSMALSFVDNRIVVGKKEAVKASIDLSKKKGDSIEKNQALMDLVNGMDKSKMLWAVAVVPPGVIPADAGEGPMAALAGVQALDLAIDYGNDLTLDLGIMSKTEDETKKIETMINTYKALIGASVAQKDPSVGKVLNGLTVTVNGKRLLLGLKVDKATLDEISQKASVAAPSGGVMEIEEEQTEEVVEEKPAAAQ